MNKMTWAVSVLFVAALSACSTEEESVAFCAAFAEGSQFTLDCNPGCEVINGANAYDGDLNTAATFAPVAGQTSAMVTVTVVNGASGVDLQAGLVPGVFVTRPASGTLTTALGTYLDGNGPVDSSDTLDQRVVQSVESGSAARTFLGLITENIFDEVRFITTYDWSSDAEAPSYFLYEVCSGGGND